MHEELVGEGEDGGGKGEDGKGNVGGADCAGGGTAERGVGGAVVGAGWWIGEGEMGSRGAGEHLCSLLFQYLCTQATTTAGCREGMALK